MLVLRSRFKIGDDKAAKIVRTAHLNGTTLRAEATRLGFISAAEFGRIVRRERMTRGD
jgi:fumarate hydratase class II